MEALAGYRRAWCVDFEFTAPPGARPVPICCVAREARSGELHRLWLAGDAPPAPPYGTGPDELFVAYYASAELGCHLACRWPMPSRILDLHAEFRRVTSGLSAPNGHGLLGALAYFGLDGVSAVEKKGMRELAMAGGPFTAAERLALLDYCQSDVDALVGLLPRMLPYIMPPGGTERDRHCAHGQALLRGRFMAAAARVEWAGVPIDADTLDRLRRLWPRLKGRLIADVDADYGVFVPAGRRPITPDTPLGAAILDEAARFEADPHRLAEALDQPWREERAAGAEGVAARRAARKATGLTHARIARWEGEGRDPVAFPGLDVKARELAGAYPALGIGRGYHGAEGHDDTDHAAGLWEVLRDRDERLPSKCDPGLLRQAAETALARPAAYGGPMTFSAARWAAYLERKGIPWPRLDSGALALDDDTFREMAKSFPAEVGPIRELRHSLSQLRLNELAVGPDGRNRTLLSAFRSSTGRNQPSNSRFIFGPSCWLRSLIRPAPGRAVAYIDWSQQELGIAAALSGDGRMMEAYRSGDFYLTFAQMAGAVPPGGTKHTHGRQRDQFKVVALGVMYSLGADGLARKLDVTPARGRELLRLHRQTFRRFWEWSDRVETEGMLACRLRTVFGWEVHAGPNVNPRSLRNFPMQGNGAEMLRLACCLATERGVAVCAPVHDALLVEGPADGIDAVVGATQQAMHEASELVLPGFPLRTEPKVVAYPNRYTDGRGRLMWEKVRRLLDEIEAEDGGQAGDGWEGIAGDTLFQPSGYHR